MARVLRRIGLVPLMLLPIAGCGSSAEKQWYKAGSYTVAEFERDRQACTKDRVLDERCLRERGWIGLSPDRVEPVAPPPSRKTY
jgi:hypothetical protein